MHVNKTNILFIVDIAKTFHFNAKLLTEWRDDRGIKYIASFIPTHNEVYSSRLIMTNICR